MGYLNNFVEPIYNFVEPIYSQDQGTFGFDLQKYETNVFSQNGLFELYKYVKGNINEQDNTIQ